MSLQGADVSQPLRVDFPQDGSRLELMTQAAEQPALRVYSTSQGPDRPLMGTVTHEVDRVRFTPSLPFLPGQEYTAEWLGIAGSKRSARFKIADVKQRPPTVRFEPDGAVLPANALKVYLHFSQPMEQGVFLDRLKLMKASGDEVVGPFRETELWSPDGKRLTVWFHPGRQKAGVNLNVDEGPVLMPGLRYFLLVSGAWRDAAGVALGKDVRWEFVTGPADHLCPQVSQWQIIRPSPRSKEPLRVRFGEALDPAVARSAITVTQAGGAGAVPGLVEVTQSGEEWTFVPEAPWQAVEYELHAQPELEDLAGNSVEKPFEVDVSVPVPKKARLSVNFSLR